jgi:hypothetical protein
VERVVVMRRQLPRAAVFALGLAVVGCFDVKTIDPGAPPKAVMPVVADERGWVAPGTNDVGVQGFWFSFGDQDDEPKRCTDYGQHPQDTGEHEVGQCSFVGFPDPAPRLWLPNDGQLCTSGNGAGVDKCVPGVPCQDEVDYSNMWGSGMGLDFGLVLDGRDPNPRRNPAGRNTWNAADHGTTGVSFDIIWPDPSSKKYLRVEFPVVLPEDGLEITRTTVLRSGEVVSADPEHPATLVRGTTSEEHPSGSPFAHAPPTWPQEDKSAILDGHVEIPWSSVHHPPETSYEFDPATIELLGIQFHVPTVKGERTPYAFCIANLAFTHD